MRYESDWVLFRSKVDDFCATHPACQLKKSTSENIWKMRHEGSDASILVKTTAREGPGEPGSSDPLCTVTSTVEPCRRVQGVWFRFWGWRV